jgi:tRNA_anti-like
MSDWEQYVVRWRALSTTEQQQELSRLSPEQRAAFDEANERLSYAPPPPPQPEAKKPFRLGRWALGCGCLSVLGVLALIAVVVNQGGGLKELERVGREAREEREAADRASGAEAVREQSQSLPEISAFELATRYDSNEIAADQSFKGKEFIVTGVVDNVGKDITDEMYVALAGPEGSIRGVQCFFSEDHAKQLASLSKGQHVRLKGEVSGLMMNVLVKDCRIVE